ncbi:uncharacterized protein LOC110702953 [Chenopodium quinoa]|uniref:uncharacterized protein LOC110702953 n=1 Tax=Chenopodium quinoa TaxID=63459 RepID=UPI000B794456|nr:uncharacterized protein LOC110702953 [Chenopodium quinoa]
MNSKFFEEKYLDYVLVPSGLILLGIYHLWLLHIIIHHPTRSVIGLNSISRHRWVLYIMRDPAKNGILGVQTIRNNLMASTLLATIAITLSSLISAIVSSSSNLNYTIHTTKYLSVLICFLVAFFCNMQTTRYYAHISFLLNVPSPSTEGREEFIEYVSEQLNRGCLYWSLGLRAFYFAFPLLLWIFGAIAMFACSCLMAILLYFLDTASSCPKYINNSNANKGTHKSDVESMGTDWSGNSNLHCSLLGNNKPHSTSTDNLFTSAR